MAFTRYAAGSDDESAIGQTAAYRGGESGLAKKKPRAAKKAEAEVEKERPPTWMGGEEEAWPAEEEQGHDFQDQSRAPPPAPEKTPHELGTEMGIPDNVISAIVHQAGGGLDMKMKDLSNLPEMFFMRLVDQTRIGEEDDATPIPAMLISKLVQWWRRAITLPPPPKCHNRPRKRLCTRRCQWRRLQTSRPKGSWKAL